MTVSVGDEVHGGHIIAEVPETAAIVHKCMVPPNISGMITKVVPDGEYTIDEPLVTVELESGKTIDLTMTQKWPIRVPRPTHHRFPASKPLVTGQRILDTMFPIAKGGTACVPGGFGTGKTMTQHQIAKWSDADIIIYIGLWRAWKRDDTGIGRVYSACGSKSRNTVDGSNNIDRQYIQHAGGCP